VHGEVYNENKQLAKVKADLRYRATYRAVEGAAGAAPPDASGARFEQLPLRMRPTRLVASDATPAVLLRVWYPPPPAADASPPRLPLRVRDDTGSAICRWYALPAARAGERIAPIGEVPCVRLERRRRRRGAAACGCGWAWAPAPECASICGWDWDWGWCLRAAGLQSLGDCMGVVEPSRVSACGVGVALLRSMSLSLRARVKSAMSTSMTDSSGRGMPGEERWEGEGGAESDSFHPSDVSELHVPLRCRRCGACGARSPEEKKGEYDVNADAVGVELNVAMLAKGGKNGS
jgi:hypothetical protein